MIYFVHTSAELQIKLRSNKKEKKRRRKNCLNVFLVEAYYNILIRDTLISKTKAIDLQKLIRSNA